MKTRILVLEPHSYWGGGQRVLKMMLDSLRDSIDPLVALPEMGTVGPDLERAGIPACTYPLGRYRSGAKSAVDKVMFGPRSAYAALRLAALIVERKIDLVYINGSRCLPAGAVAAGLTGRPSLFCLHQTLSQRAEILIASAFARQVSCIVACSQAAADSLLRARPGLAAKLRVLYSPVDEARSAGNRSVRQHEKPGLAIGMVGRITGAKGHHVLLSALARLNPSPRVLFVGAPAPGNRQDSAYLQMLRSMAAERDVNVEWTGYHTDPTPYYSVIDVLVVASTGEEGMPLVVMEAFQRGIPVVASRLGGLPEIVKDGVNGLLVRPGDPEALAIALERLTRDPQLLARLGAGARATIDERFSKTAYCSAIASLISELCASHSPVATPVVPESEG